jgi:hypothetical protein
MAIRDTQLCLLAAGGAELVDVDSDDVLWASDTDEDFQEEFPELLDENDVEHLLDYLVEHEVIKEREADLCDVIGEPLDPDEDDDDNEDECGDELEDWDQDGDIIDGEVIKHG